MNIDRPNKAGTNKIVARSQQPGSLVSALHTSNYATPCGFEGGDTGSLVGGGTSGH